MLPWSLEEFNKKSQEIYQYAKEKGWWEKPRSEENILMLIITEIAEATEAYRNNEPSHYAKEYGEDGRLIRSVSLAYMVPEEIGKLKPEGEAVELMDAVIRVLDYMGYKGWIFQEDAFNMFTTKVAEYKAEDTLDFHFKLVSMLTNSIPLVVSFSLFIDAICTYFKIRGWDFDLVFRAKHAYNQNRPYRHGGKLA